jgi:hypothetical protein
LQSGTATQELINKVNNLDRQVTQIMLVAEQTQCPKQHKSEWLLIIHHQSLELCRYWALVVKGTRNKIDTNRQSMEIFTQLPERMQEEILQVTRFHHLTTTSVECYRQLRLAMKYHKELLRCQHELRHQSLLTLK